MKKITGLVLVLILGLTLVGCEDREEVKTKSSKPKKVEHVKLNI